MSENTLFLGNKIFEIPLFFQTRPGDLGKKVHACSLRFSALNLSGAVGPVPVPLDPVGKVFTYLFSSVVQLKQNNFIGLSRSD